MSQSTIHKLERQLKECEANSTRIYDKLKKVRQHNAIKVSDHAVLRYLERVKSMNMESVLQEMITPDVLKYYHQFGDGEFPMGIDNVRVLIKDGCIVTVKK